MGHPFAVPSFPYPFAPISVLLIHDMSDHNSGLTSWLMTGADQILLTGNMTNVKPHVAGLAAGQTCWPSCLADIIWLIAKTVSYLFLLLVSLLRRYASCGCKIFHLLLTIVRRPKYQLPLTCGCPSIAPPLFPRVTHPQTLCRPASCGWATLPTPFGAPSTC
jgi:hypothetical protein